MASHCKEFLYNDAQHEEETNSATVTGFKSFETMVDAKDEIVVFAMIMDSEGVKKQNKTDYQQLLDFREMGPW